MARCEPGCKCARHSPNRPHDKNLTCEECGASFAAHRRNARFCSEECRHKAYVAANRDKLRESQRQYVAAHREQRRATVQRYDAKHRDEKNAQQNAVYNEDTERGEARRARHRQYYQDNKERLRARARIYRAEHRNKYLAEHGADRDVLFADFWAAQDGRCYLCGCDLSLIPRKEVHIDHDHSCCGPERTCEKCRRGLACKRCNFIIAWANEDPERLRRIAANLEAAKAAHQPPPRRTPEVVRA